MSKLTKAFAKNDAKRRTLRDEKRASFFKDHGLSIMSNPFALDVDPKAQLSVVLHLLENAMEQHPDETSAIRQMHAALNLFHLDQEVHTSTDRDRPMPTHLYPGAWSSAFFNVK